MSWRGGFISVLILAVGVVIADGAARTPDEVVQLWTGTPPGVSRASGPEKRVEGRPRPFYQLTDIATPTLEVFRPPANLLNGTAVLVCPGGGLQRLAYEHEGLEVADWLNSLGLTAFVLKYRVPAPAETALLDAQRAMGLIRHSAANWQIDPAAIGVLGFSAGGEIAAWLVTHAEDRGYPVIDDADRASCRPDFAGLIYPGGLLQRGGVVKEAIGTNLNDRLPPAFLAHALDDASDNSLQFAVALKRSRAPFELHVYQEGAHGFGVRETGVPADDWRERFREWLAVAGHFDAPAIRSFATEFVGKGGQPPAFGARLPAATLVDAYVAQRRIVRHARGKEAIAGYKGAGASVAAQTALKIGVPLVGVLFKRGQLSASNSPSISRAGTGTVIVETEIGYIMGMDFSFAVLTDEQARDVVDAVVPVIELPRSFEPPGSTPDARNLVAANIGSDRFIVGRRLAPKEVEPDGLKIELRKNGQTLHETSGANANGGQWRNLRSILNQITAQGYTIRAGDLIICGALGKVQPGEPGHYEARYGDHETIKFELK